MGTNWQVGGLEGGTEGIGGRSVLDVNVRVGCWEVMFRALLVLQLTGQMTEEG